MTRKPFKLLFILLVLSVLCYRCTSTEQQKASFLIPYTTDDFAVFVTPPLHIEGNDAFLCKRRSISKYNLLTRELSWQRSLSHTARACLVAGEYVLVATTAVLQKKQHTLLTVYQSQNAALVYTDTVEGRLDFVWNLPETPTYLLQTTLYRASTISNFLQKRSFAKKALHWQVNSGPIDKPSHYKAPYAYIGQQNKLYQLDVESGELQQNCLDQLDTICSFYQQQQPTAAHRSRLWHQRIQRSCLLDPTGWNYKISEEDNATTLLGNRGDSVIYQVDNRNNSLRQWRTLKAPLGVLLKDTQKGSGVVYYLENRDSLYKSVAPNVVSSIALIGSPSSQPGFETLITYSHPYIAYLSKVDTSATAFNVVFQNIEE